MLLKTVLFLLPFMLAVSCNQKPVLYLTGDSTMAYKPAEAEPERGWGQLLPEFFNEKIITIDNHARNGRSTRSFIYEGFWDSVLAMMNKGDYLVIQFCHNDGVESKLSRYCTLQEFEYNLSKFIKESKSKGVKPILCTPVERRKFDTIGVLVDTHGEYPDVLRKVAQKNGVLLIDLQQKTHKLIQEYGPVESKKLFMHVPPGKYPNYPNGRADNTHFVEKGAREVAGLFIAGLKEKNHELVKYLKE
ncbi:MAG: rhamnogalacturonan acetylesterase [Bacteroidales bacterium]|nr:rhamnogalacturonan acetylesterase [Bacteroidales bacterium]